MEMFVRVVETGSFSAVARDLKTCQRAISKAIAGLEDRLGTRLPVRSTRQLSQRKQAGRFINLPSAAMQRRTKRKHQPMVFGQDLKADYESAYQQRSRGSTWLRDPAHFSTLIPSLA